LLETRIWVSNDDLGSGMSLARKDCGPQNG